MLITEHCLRVHHLFLFDCYFQPEVLILLLMFDDYWDLILTKEVDESVTLQGPAHEIMHTRDFLLAENIPLTAKLIGYLEWALCYTRITKLKFPFGLICVLLVRLFRKAALRI